MSELSAMKCTACRGDEPTLTDDEIVEKRGHLSDRNPNAPRTWRSSRPTPSDGEPNCGAPRVDLPPQASRPPSLHDPNQRLPATSFRRRSRAMTLAGSSRIPCR
jgi:hypothetical protein